MSDDNDKFSVYWYDPDGNYYPERQFIGAKEAVELAASLTTRPAAKLGVIQRVIITDSGDCCVFEWLHGKGVVYPPESEIQNAGLRRKDA